MRIGPMKPTQNLKAGPAFLSEMKEFGTFPKGAQRYIRRSLDIALKRHEPIGRWSRDPREVKAISIQVHNYNLMLSRIQQNIPPNQTELRYIEHFMGALISLAGFDLSQGKLPDFASFRFLYERIFGAAIRPWLPTAYVAAASLPNLQPERRVYLLQNISESACKAVSWVTTEPVFFPEWVEKVELPPKELPPA